MGFMGTFIKGIVTGVIGLGGVAYLYTKFCDDVSDESDNAKDEED